MGQEITLFGICHPNLSVISLVRGGLLFSQVRPILALLLNLGHFWPFVLDST